MSEHLLAGRQFALSGTDKEQVVELVAALDDRFTYAAGLQRSELYRQVEQRARDFVLENRKPILLLATMLAEFQILGSASIDEVLGTPIPEVA
jgi:hypothetical protein